MNFGGQNDLDRFAVFFEQIEKRKSDAGAVGPSKCLPAKVEVKLTVIVTWLFFFFLFKSTRTTIIYFV